jgi:hypothetical protein
MCDNTDIVYLAGFIDGEGHFYKPNTINGRGKHYTYPRIVISQKDIKPLEWIKARWGGNIYSYPNINRWSIQGKRAVQLARQLQPHLIVKSEQVKVIL